MSAPAAPAAAWHEAQPAAQNTASPCTASPVSPCTAATEPARRPRILFLADRNILADQAYNAFSPFADDARVRIDPARLKKTGNEIMRVITARRLLEQGGMLDNLL